MNQFVKHPNQDKKNPTNPCYPLSWSAAAGRWGRGLKLAEKRALWSPCFLNVQTKCQKQNCPSGQWNVTIIWSIVKTGTESFDDFKFQIKDFRL